jgi:hypothetical protein
MARRVKQGGAVPGYGLTAVNLGDPLRRQFERVCRRSGVSLSDYIRTSLERDIAQEWFWKFQALRYLIQTLRMALGGDFVSKTLGFSARQRRELSWDLQELQKLVESKAEEKFAQTLSPEEREKRYGGSDASGRQTKGIVNRPKGSPHWDFNIPEVERILDAL